MIDWLVGLLAGLFGVSTTRAHASLHVLGVVMAAAAFVLLSTSLVAYDSLFMGANNISALQVGDVAPQDVRAPFTVAPYISNVLTEQRRSEVRNSAPEIYFPPDPSVSRQQSELVLQILDYIENVRHDPYGTVDQKIEDIRQIRDLQLDDAVIALILAFDDRIWADVREQITIILERILRGEIRPGNVASVIAQLPIQVSVRATEDQSRVIVAIIKDLIRPNTLLNTEATEAGREAAAAEVTVRRSFERGQVVVRLGERIDEAAYEALGKMGLLESSNQRAQDILRALLASLLILVITGLYISRFTPFLLRSSRFLTLLAAIFLLFLLGARLSGNAGQLYLYPTAALAFLYVVLVGPEIALIGVLALAVLTGLMEGNSLESTLYVGIGGLMATLTLRRPERLNGYFMPGLLVSLVNVAVVIIAYQGSLVFGAEGLLGEHIVFSLINGILAAAVALGGMYIVTQLFNLPTGLKLVELSQPSQPLLQRVLREAPGTYQHSLQVANLAEQAAHAIGANADLVRVAALYHDVGKVINAAFFTENQAEGLNPHDVLNDPARSAAIIIGHVTEGEKIARQYRLPARIRDFILEHHGTQVLYFYDQAVARAGDDEGVDVEQFTYPGPRPRSRETGILMLADSSEAAVRSHKPTRKQDIQDVVQQIFETKIRTGQLDDSGLTLNDIKVMRRIFVDMLQAVFHPRINYPSQLKQQPKEASSENERLAGQTEVPAAADAARKENSGEFPAVLPLTPGQDGAVVSDRRGRRKSSTVAVVEPSGDDDAPLPDVPPLPRTSEHAQVNSNENGRQPEMKADVGDDSTYTRTQNSGA